MEVSYKKCILKSLFLTCTCISQTYFNSQAKRAKLNYCYFGTGDEIGRI